MMGLAKISVHIQFTHANSMEDDEVAFYIPLMAVSVFGDELFQ